MRMRLQEGERKDELSWDTWQVVLHGDPLDDRGHSVLGEVTSKSALMKRFQYLPNNLEIVIDSTPVRVDELADALRPTVTGRVLLEATTLGLAEIVLCCRALRVLGHDAFDIVYVEPNEYHRPRIERLLHKRDFELSSEVPGYRA